MDQSQITSKKQLDDIKTNISSTIINTPNDLVNIVIEYIDNRIKCGNCRADVDLNKLLKCRECTGYYCQKCEPSDYLYIVNFICESCFIDKCCNR